MVILKNGDRLTFRCEFQHKGKAFTGAKLYAAIGRKGIFFDEATGLNGTVTVSGIKDDTDWTTYIVNVDIPISNVKRFGVPPGSDYEAYVKLMSIPGPDIFWYGPANDITLVSDEEVLPAAFENLTVSYSKS